MAIVAAQPAETVSLRRCERGGGGGESLLVQTARRVDAADGFSEPIFVCNEEHRFLVAEELREAGLNPGLIIWGSGVRILLGAPILSIG